MNLQTENIKTVCICPREEIVAYIDGELSPREELELDLHLADCKVCLEELNAQKKVSTTLEILLEDKADDFELPENFTKVVTAKAESNVSGLRQPRERSKAFLIFAVLSLTLILGLGTEIETVWSAFDKFADRFLTLGGFIWHTILEIAIGFAVVFGSLCQHFIYGSLLILIFVLGTLAMTALILSKTVLYSKRS